MTTSVPPTSLNTGGQAKLPPRLSDSEPRPRRYTVASFDNLVVLANYEERLREARRMVWRDRGEPAVEVHDLWECLEHGTRGGLRTFFVPILAHGYIIVVTFSQVPGLSLLPFAPGSISSCS
jgi:hypothetical protein